MKSLACFVLLFLVTPGSGQLLFDGLPLSTRAEFAAIAVLVLVSLSKDVRQRVRRQLEESAWRGAIRPALGLLILLKLLTFAWLPYSDGFSACYRSLYYPISNPESCEKSYESPFSRSGVVIDNSSRIDRAIDFGAHMHDWGLPFMNEYPRLSALWLDRFPFTVLYGAVLKNDSEQSALIPIYGNGDISGRVNQTTFSNEIVPLVDRYEFPRLSVVEIPKGISEFALNYRFTDDDASEPPDQKPPARGPYATLKVGSPQTRDEVLAFAQVRIRGWTVDTARAKTPDFVVATDRSGRELGRSSPQERPDVAAYVGLPKLTSNGFSLAVPARSLEAGGIEIKAIYSDRTVVIGSLTSSDQFMPELPITTVKESSGMRTDFQTWFDADRSDFTPLTPEYQGSIGLALRTLLILIDAVTLLILGLLVVTLVVALQSSLFVAGALGLVSYGVVNIGSRYAPEILGLRTLLPLMLLSTVIVFVTRKLPNPRLVVFLPMSVTLASYKVFDQLERLHGSQGERWWGRLLYYWRDSDWFATQGYARTVFVESSLRGGESVFWFQAGPRYLAFATRMLFGENDVLVGILMVTLGFFAVFVLHTSAQRYLRSIPLAVVGGLGLFVLLFFMSDDLMAGFGFVGSSEYPTWIGLLMITSFLVSVHTEARSWPMIGMAIALGYSIQLRPNQIGGVVLMFVALILIVDRIDRVRSTSTVGTMVVVFAGLLSFSLIHNLYYGETFVPFTANAGINYAFSWRDVLGLDPGPAGWSEVWAQLRFMMYWNAIGNYSWALMFWGSQVCWLTIVGLRLRRGVALKVRSLYLLIPLGYALPMLKYQMTSYYPRHLVVINLSFLCAALMAWPRDEELKPATSPVLPEVAAVQPAPHGISTI